MRWGKPPRHLAGLRSYHTKERNAPPPRAPTWWGLAEGGGPPPKVASLGGGIGRTCSARPRTEAEEDKGRGLRRARAPRKVGRVCQRGATNATRGRGSPSLTTRQRQGRSTRREAPLALAEREACGGKPRVPYWVGCRGKRGLGAKRAQGIRSSFSAEKVEPGRAHFLALVKPKRRGCSVLGWFWLWLFRGKPKSQKQTQR